MPVLFILLRIVDVRGGFIPPLFLCPEMIKKIKIDKKRY